MNFDYWLELNEEQIRRGLNLELSNYSSLIKYLRQAYDSGIEEGIRRTFWNGGKFQ